MKDGQPKGRKPRKTSRADQSAKRRRQLLLSTITVIARKGLSGITMNDIAMEAGCSYGVVAFHFKTKQRMLLAALDHLGDEYGVLWKRTIAGAVAPSAAERLGLMVGIDFDYRVAKPKHLAVWLAFWAEASRVPAYRKLCGELKQRSLTTTVNLVRELATERGMDIDIDAVARSLYMLSDGCWIYSHVTGEAGPAERERYRHLCFTFLATIFPQDFTAQGVIASRAAVTRSARATGAAHRQAPSEEQA